MDKIKVHLLGRPYVEVNGKRVNFPYKKAEGFFYYLCVKKNATREEGRELIARTEKVTRYEPQDHAGWEASYQTYETILRHPDTETF